MKEEIPLKDLIKFVLEESRVILPGVQALFGFQLIAVFNERFADLDSMTRYIHLVATFFTCISVALIMAPAAYHRQVEPETASHAFVTYASKLICAGLFPLILSMTLDSYVVTKVVTGDSLVASFAAVAPAILPLFLWYYIPQREKRRQEKNRQDGLDEEHAPLQGPMRSVA